MNEQGQIFEKEMIVSKEERYQLACWDLFYI